MKAFLETMQWAEKPKLSKEVLLVIAIVVAGGVAVFKLRPYFMQPPHVAIESLASHHEPKISGLSSLLEHLNVGTSISSKAGSEDRHRSSERHEGSYARSDRKGPAIIERPLFDGLTIYALKAILLNAVSSHALDTPIEASVLEIVRDDTTADLDGGPIEGAKVVGLVNPNLLLKRLGFAFSEMISTEKVEPMQSAGTRLIPRRR